MNMMKPVLVEIDGKSYLTNVRCDKDIDPHKVLAKMKRENRKEYEQEIDKVRDTL